MLLHMLQKRDFKCSTGEIFPVKRLGYGGWIIEEVLRETTTERHWNCSIENKGVMDPEVLETLQ